MIELVSVEPTVVAPLYRVRVEEQIEHEYTHSWFEFYHTEEDMKRGEEEIDKRCRTPKGDYIPNVDYIDFEEEQVSFEHAKSDMTVAQFENLYGVKVEDLL